MKVYLAILLCIVVLVAALAFPWDSVCRPRAGESRAVEESLAALGSESYEERESAAARLHALGEAARPALLSAARSGDPETRLRAARILREIDRERETLTERRRREFARIIRSGLRRPDMLREGTLRFRVLGLDSRTAAEVTVREAGRVENDPLRLQRAVILLCELRHPAGAPLLADLLSRGWVLPSTLYHASEGLRDFGSEAVRPALRDAVRSEDPESRKYALRALATCGRREDLDVVREAAGDSEERVRVEAAAALSLLGGDAAVRDLMALLEDPAAAVRAAALASLSRIPAAPALEAARSGLADPAPAVRAAALRVIRARGTEEDGSPARPLLADPSPRVRGEAIRTLSALGAGYAAASAGIRDRAPSVRRLALLAARELPAGEQSGILALARGEEDPYLRRLRDWVLGDN